MKKIVSLFLMMLLSSALFAQVTTSSISGTVVDEKGELLIGATVKAVHTPTGTVYGTTTMKNGAFNVGGMRVGGPYAIEISFIGYNNEVVKDVFLTLGEEASFNVKMKESSSQLGEVIVVGSASPVVNSNRTGAQEVITKSMMEKLPTINRSLSDFTKLTPMSSGGNFGGTSYRFNNVTVDGASFNNSFGLSSSLGASGTEPISLEAIEQVQVMIAPFDVRNGAFTGAGINSVTKSGTNNWEAAAYTYIKSSDITGWRQKDDEPKMSNFADRQYGVSLGGAIVKNKLFFFINGEMDRQERPINYKARKTKNDPISGVYSKADEVTLDEISKFLQDKFNYNPGKYNVDNTPTEANRITARLDWNINSKSTLSLKYFYLKSFNTNMPSSSGAPAGGRGPNNEAIPYSSTFYRTNNNFNIVMADLNTTINSKLSNTLKVGYSALRDFREMDGGFFPQVDIKDGAGRSFTTFGTEANSYNNLLNSDVFQIQDNLTWNVGKHQIVFGTQSDIRKFKNGYCNSFAGQYTYNNLDDFYADANTYLNWVAAGSDPAKKPTGTKATYFKQAFAKNGNEFPYAYIDVLSLGFYVQDKWTVRPGLNVTLGLRADMPIFLNKLDANPAVEALAFQGGEKIDVSQLPKTSVLFSPRIGVNWDVFGDRSLQLRGGTGLFTGTPPYVWLSNQAGNNGLLFGLLSHRPFDGQALYTPTAAEVASSKMDLAVTAKNFKYPQLWKTNIAADYDLWDGWILTGEILYNKDVNAIYHDNIGLNESVAKIKEGGADGRNYYTKKDADGKTNQYITTKTENVVVMRNTKEGYSVYSTIQLQKEYRRGVMKGFYFNGSYSLGKSMSVTDGSSSVASSAWKYRPAVEPNAQELSYSAASFDNRLLLQAAYRADWSKNASTSFGVIYQRYRPFRYSYTYNGDVNGDGQNMNDLIFIPRTKDDIKLSKDSGKLPDNTAIVDNRTIDQVWEDINSFIEQDAYLSKHRGEYAKRNGAIVPFANQIDVNITHDFKIVLGNGKVNTLRFSFDIVNFANLLNKNWGVQSTTVYGYSGSPQYQFLKMTQAPSATNDYTPTFTMPVLDNKPNNERNSVVTNTFKDLNGSSSRWAMQFGVKYLFN